MDYFNIIPLELNEIIVSYMLPDELSNLLKTFNIFNLNWNTIHTYHFGEYKSIYQNEYLKKLGIESLINKLNLDFNINELLDLDGLDLSFNNLTQIPPEIGNLTNLQILELTSNKLTQVPPEIGNLTNLQVLNISYNQLTQVPSEIGNLTNLIELDLSYNKLTQVPSEIGNLKNLKYLYLSNNQLTQIPSEIWDLPNLNYFDLIKYKYYLK